MSGGWGGASASRRGQDSKPTCKQLGKRGWPIHQRLCEQGRLLDHCRWVSLLHHPGRGSIGHSLRWCPNGAATGSSAAGKSVKLARSVSLVCKTVGEQTSLVYQIANTVLSLFVASCFIFCCICQANSSSLRVNQPRHSPDCSTMAAMKKAAMKMAMKAAAPAEAAPAKKTMKKAMKAKK